MCEKSDIAIAIIRIEKLLAGVSVKLQETFEKNDIENSLLIQKIIELIELFKDFIIARMKKTFEVERAHAINLRDCRTQIAELSSELKVLQDMFDEQNLNSEIFLKENVACINDEEQLIKSIKETSEMQIPREIEQSMSEMLTTRETEEMRKKLIQSEIDSTKQKLHSVMEFNAETEKKLFEMCAEIERKYSDVLAKYDLDIGACHALMEKLSKDNEIIKAEKKDMEDRLAIQRVLYVQLREEREIGLMKAFTGKLEHFRRNRAVKIIQKTWRAYFERISLKKRRKSKKK